MGRSERVARASSAGWIGLLVGAMYGLAYLYSVQNIVVAPGVDLIAGAPVPSASVAADWSAKMWKPIAPFVWEPVVGLFPLRSVAVFISVPNLLLALVLGALVGLNVSLAAERTRAARAAGSPSGSMKGLLASAPSLLTGFTCCVPTVILAMGSLAASFTIAIIALRPYFIPAAVVALSANVFWSVRALRRITLQGAAGFRETAPDRALGGRQP